MASVRLSITTKEPSAVLLPGDRVEGVIECVVEKDCTCKGVVLIFGWKGTSKGDDPGRNEFQIVLPGGEWRTGDRIRLPFSMDVFDGPPTFHGSLFQIRWSLRAQAELSWALDPAVEKEVVVGLPLGATGGVEASRVAAGGALGCAVLPLVIGALLLALAYALPPPSLPPLAAWIGFGVALPIGVYFLLLDRTRRGLGTVILEAGPSPCRRAGEVAVRAVFQPRRRTELRKPTASLVREESAPRTTSDSSPNSRSTGKSTTIFTDGLMVATVPLRGPAVLEGGATGTCAGILPVPPGGPPTFSVGRHSVRWKVLVSVSVPGFPDSAYSQRIEIT